MFDIWQRLTSVVRDVFRSPLAGRRGRRRRPAYRPLLLWLEEREAPAVFNVAAGDVTHSGFADVVTADRFVTDLSDQDALNRVWGEYFRDAKPATTTVQVVRLATDPRCLVEINAVAVID